MKKLKLLPIIIMLIAGLITCIISFVKHFDNIDALAILLFVLITFYVIGLIARTIIIKVCFPKEEVEEQEDLESEEVATGEEVATSEEENKQQE